MLSCLKIIEKIERGGFELIRTRQLIGFLLIFYSFTTICNAEIVKLSRSGICHPEYSPYYTRTTHYTSYSTLEACLAAGGRLPKNVSAKPSASKQAKPEGAPYVPKNQSLEEFDYKREYFGRGWADLDHDCQNSRMEVLIAQSTGPVHFADAGKCRVTLGRWISPYTGEVIRDASQIDIDHVVPLKWAWDHNANQWSMEKREQFANDPANLLSVEASLNRQKGAQGPVEWLPPENQCEYVLRFLRVLKKYQLEEPSGLGQVRQRVCK